MQQLKIEQLMALQAGLRLPSRMDALEKERAFSGVSVAIALSVPQTFNQAFRGQLPPHDWLAMTEVNVRLRDDVWLYEGLVDVTPVVESEPEFLSWMTVYDRLTVKEMLQLFPEGFAVSYSGSVSRIVDASSHPLFLQQSDRAPANGGFLRVEMVAE